MPARANLTGQTFGRLTVVQYVGPSNSGKALWDCLCACGKKATVVTSHLRNGHTQSCGCLHDEKLGEMFTTHGYTRGGKTKEYMCWLNMKKRCLNPIATHYDRYGGRGIKVCEQWVKSFEDFYKDMGPCPEKYTIERIDNDGNYEPGNCRWATRGDQVRNTRRNHWIEFNGRKMVLNDWAKELGIPRRIIGARLNRYGWTIERALTQPVRPGNNKNGFRK